jgi:hypothetical protein
MSFDDCRPTRQWLQQAPAGIFADDSNRPSSQRELLTLTESIHIEKLPGSRTRDLAPRAA